MKLNINYLKVNIHIKQLKLFLNLDIKKYIYL